MSKDFWSLPVNPVRHVPGFMKGGKADNEHSNPVLLPLVPEFTNICISHLQFLHFQKFLLEVVAIGRKNAGWESDSMLTRLPSRSRILEILTYPRSYREVSRKIMSFPIYSITVHYTLYSP
jgi:hypothetical protein